MNKPRSDSVLKTLPPDRRAAIAEYLRAHSLAEGRAWLAADGLKTSEASLSEFLSWQTREERYARNASMVEALMQRRAERNPEWTPEMIQEEGQIFFTEMALEEEDPRQWFYAQQLALKKRQLDFDQEKFKETLRTKLESAFNELAIAVKGNPLAEEHIAKARELIAPTK